MKYKQWNFAVGCAEATEELRRSGISPLNAMVLARRGVRTAAEAEAFLACGENLLHDPFLLRDMDCAVARIRQAVEQNETIAVFGDYDVDGITSTCLLTLFLREQGAHVAVYIPDRLQEGYSLNTDAITRLRLQGVRLLVCVDCGITSLQEVRFARSIGMDVVITDHHECLDALPEAAAVVNPHRSDCNYPFQELAGVGVALKLALAMTPVPERHTVLHRYIDLAAIGTVADVVQLTDENRAIVSIGLQSLTATRRPGLRALLRECGLDRREITSGSIGFVLAPRLNAAGRMGAPLLAAELLMTDNAARGEELARQLCDLNRERQRIEQDILHQCLVLLRDRPELSQNAIVLAGRNWHKGVVGIVASRLTERFSVPVFMICLDADGNGKGSCRSYGGLNLFSSLLQCEELLEGFGGHELAAGFTIREENIGAFRKKMGTIAACRAVTHPAESALDIEVVLEDARLLTLKNVAELRQLEPFGSGNPQPIFALRSAEVHAVTGVGNGRHTRLKISQNGVFLDAILFSASPESTGLRPDSRADMAFYPEINEFRGLQSVQLTLEDVQPLPSLAQLDRSLYQRWQIGEPFSRRELEMLLPARQDFVAVWRYLAAHAADSSFRESPERLARNIARHSGLRESYARTMICLEVFQERGLLRLESEENAIQIFLESVEGKVDLNASRILIDLKNMLEQLK